MCIRDSTEANQIVTSAQKTATARGEEIVGEARAQACLLYTSGVQQTLEVAEDAVRFDLVIHDQNEHHDGPGDVYKRQAVDTGGLGKGNAQDQGAGHVALAFGLTADGLTGSSLSLIHI